MLPSSRGAPDPARGDTPAAVDPDARPSGHDRDGHHVVRCPAGAGRTNRLHRVGRLAYTHAAQVRDDLRGQREFVRALEQDPFRNMPDDDLLAGLRGKDVLLVFVESYGRTALDLPVVESALDAGSGGCKRPVFFAERLPHLSTFGGLSWLAEHRHCSPVCGWTTSGGTTLSTLDRLTLTDAFGRAGWRTVADAPANKEDWPMATTYYRLRPGLRPPERGICRPAVQLRLDAGSVHPGRAPAPGARAAEPGTRHGRDRPGLQPHPWVPLPRLVDWSRVGDGSVFDPMPAEGESPEEVWRDPDLVKAAYAESVAYTLDAVTSFVQQLHDQELVLVVLGDHQPASIVAGQGEPRRAREHHRCRPGSHGSGDGLGLAGGAPAGQRRTGLADGCLPGQVPHHFWPAALAHVLGTSLSASSRDPSGQRVHRRADNALVAQPVAGQLQ